MKYLPLLIFILLVPSAFSQSIPVAYPLDRYDTLRKHLPFGKPTTIETEAPKPPPFSDDLTLIGYSKMGKDYYVTVMNKKTQQKIQINPKEKPDGITVAEVLNPSDIHKIEVKLKKGDEVGTVIFDPNFLNPANNQMVNPPIPTQMPLAGNSNQIPPPPSGINEVPPSVSPYAENATNQAIKNPTVRRIRRVIFPTQSP